VIVRTESIVGSTVYAPTASSLIDYGKLALTARWHSEFCTDAATARVLRDCAQALEVLTDAALDREIRSLRGAGGGS
jgi:hypothetical protein